MFSDSTDGFDVESHKKAANGKRKSKFSTDTKLSQHSDGELDKRINSQWDSLKRQHANLQEPN